MTDIYDDYCDFTGTTAIYPQHVASVYLALGLCSEAAECVELVYLNPLLGCVGDGGGELSELGDELGDVQWYVARLAHTYDIGFSTIVNGAKRLYQPHGYDVEDLLTLIAMKAGLIAGKVKKQLRDGDTWTDAQRAEAHQFIGYHLTGVILLTMYAANWLYANHGVEYSSYDKVLTMNRRKLEGRQQRGALHGDGNAR